MTKERIAQVLARLNREAPETRRGMVKGIELSVEDLQLVAGGARPEPVTCSGGCADDCGSPAC